MYVRSAALVVLPRDLFDLERRRNMLVLDLIQAVVRHPGLSWRVGRWWSNQVDDEHSSNRLAGQHMIVLTETERDTRLRHAYNHIVQSLRWPVEKRVGGYLRGTATFSS